MSNFDLLLTTQTLGPPPPEVDEEEETRAFWERYPLPGASGILTAAHNLHQELRQWSSQENEIVAAAKRMAILMARLSQLVRGEGGTKKDLINCAKAIADSSEEVTRLAVQLARQCTDIRVRLHPRGYGSDYFKKLTPELQNGAPLK